MAIGAGWPFNRKKRSAGYAPRFRKFSEAISERNPDDRWRRSIARPASGAGSRTEDRQSRFVHRFHFTETIARPLLCVGHFPAPERDWSLRKPGRNSKFNVGSNGEWTAGVRESARRISGSNRERRVRRPCARA